MSHILHVTWFTFFQATLSTLMALFVGLPAAFFCGRRRFFGRKVLLSLSAVPFCIPSLLIALGYVTFLGMNGGLNHFLMFVFGFKKPPVTILYSFVGLIIAHGFYNFSLIMKNVSEAWERIPTEPAESARLLGASEARIFRTVTIHQLMPSIASSSLLVFIYCFLSFVLVLLFGGLGNSTLEVEIYKAGRATLNYPQMWSLAGLETFLLIVVTVFYISIETKTSSRVQGLVSGEWNVRIKLQSFTERVVFALFLLLICVFFVAPLLGIVFNAFAANHVRADIKRTGFTLETFRRVFKMKTFWPSVHTSFIVACCSGMLCTLVGFLYSVFLKTISYKREYKSNLIFKIIPMLPMSISSVVVGILITLMVRRGNVAHLVAAQVFLTWPLAYRIIYPTLSKISRDTMDSAVLMSRGWWDVVYRIYLPIGIEPCLTAFGFCIAASAGDTTLPLVLSIPKFDTLSLFTYRLAGAYKFNEACAAGVVLGLMCGLVFVITGRRKK